MFVFFVIVSIFYFSDAKVEQQKALVKPLGGLVYHFAKV